MKNDVHTMETAVGPVKEAIDNKTGTMIVFRFPSVAKELFDSVENLPMHLMVGPVQKREGEIYTIQNGTYCTKEELELFDYLANKGVDVFFQVVPDMKRIDWKDIRGKLL